MRNAECEKSFFDSAFRIPHLLPGMTMTRVKTRGIEVALMVAITLVLLALIEAGVRVIAPQAITMEYLNGIPLGTRHPELRYVYNPGAHTRERTPEFVVDYHISPEGFRDRIDHTQPKDAKVTRLLLLGDSFAFGAANAYEHIWPVLFERNLQHRGYAIEVIKAGAMAYDTRTEWLYLQQLLPQYQPDVVLLTFLANDLMTNQPLAQAASVTMAQARSDIAVVRAQKTAKVKNMFHVVTLLKRTLFAFDRIYLGIYMRTWHADYFTDSPIFRQQVKITQQLLTQFRQMCAQYQARFAVLSLPQLAQVLAKAYPDAAAGLEADRIDTVLGQYARAEGFVWIPLLPALAETYRDAGKDVYFRLDGHLNALGNRQVAQELTPRFVEHFAAHLHRLSKP